MCMQKAAEAMVSICRGTKKLRTKLGYKCNFKVAHILICRVTKAQTRVSEP